MNLESVCEFTGGGERFLSYSFEQARKSLFPLGKSKFFPNQKHAPKSPWPGMSMTSLIEEDQSSAMLKILKEQHAYVISQHNYLMRTQAEKDQAQDVAVQNTVQVETQAQQMELVRDVLSSFQESMAMMMQLTTEMVSKACEANAVVTAPVVAPNLPPPPVFQKSAVSHRRPVIRDIPDREAMPVKVKTNVETKAAEPVAPLSHQVKTQGNISRVQPHPISKRLERVKKD